MLVGVAPLLPSFPPSETWAFYFINRPSRANISVPSVAVIILKKFLFIKMDDKRDFLNKQNNILF